MKSAQQDMINKDKSQMANQPIRQIKKVEDVKCERKGENRTKCTAKSGFFKYSWQIEINQQCSSSVLSPRSKEL